MVVRKPVVEFEGSSSSFGFGLLMMLLLVGELESMVEFEGLVSNLDSRLLAMVVRGIVVREFEGFGSGWGLDSGFSIMAV